MTDMTTDTRYTDILSQLDGYTVVSTLCSSTKFVARESFSRKVDVYTTIFKDRAPTVSYQVLIGKTSYSTQDLSYALTLYLDA